MTETLSHSTASAEAKRPSRIITGAPEAVQLESLDALVGFKKSLKEQYDADNSSVQFDEYYQQKLTEVLAAKGITDDENDIARHSEYEYIQSVYQLVSELDSDEEWKLVDMHDPQRKEIPRSVMYKMLKDHYANETSVFADQSSTPEAPLQSPEPSESAPADEAESTATPEEEASSSHDTAQGASTHRAELTYKEMDSAVEAYTALLDKYAMLVAERSKRMVEGAKTRRDIEATKEELGDMLGALASMYMDELESEGVSWDDIPGEIDTFIAEQTDEVLQKMEAHRMEEYNNSRPIMKKFYDKWAQWGEQGTKGKVKKAAAFALPGAALGAALVPLAGVVGFGAATGALAVTGARSVGRRLAGAHLDKRADAKKVAQAQREEIRSEIEATEDALHTDILAIIDERSEAYRKQNLRRTAGGLAIALSVGLLTAKGADILADNVNNWSFGKLGDLGKPDVDAPNPGTSGPDLDGDGIPDISDRDIDGDGVNNGRDYAPTNPNVTDAPVSTRDQLFDGRLGTRELTPEGHEALAEQLNGYTVKPGDSVWSLSEQFLHEQGVQNPTVYEIDATKDALLSELRASGDVDSQGWLSVGDKIHIK